MPLLPPSPLPPPVEQCLIIGSIQGVCASAPPAAAAVPGMPSPCVCRCHGKPVPCNPVRAENKRCGECSGIPRGSHRVDDIKGPCHKPGNAFTAVANVMQSAAATPTNAPMELCIFTVFYKVILLMFPNLTYSLVVVSILVNAFGADDVRRYWFCFYVPCL